MNDSTNSIRVLCINPETNARSGHLIRLFFMSDNFFICHYVTLQLMITKFFFQRSVPNSRFQTKNKQKEFFLNTFLSRSAANFSAVSISRTYFS